MKGGGGWRGGAFARESQRPLHPPTLPCAAPQGACAAGNGARTRRRRAPPPPSPAPFPSLSGSRPIGALPPSPGSAGTAPSGRWGRARRCCEGEWAGRMCPGNGVACAGRGCQRPVTAALLSRQRSAGRPRSVCRYGPPGPEVSSGAWR